MKGSTKARLVRASLYRSLWAALLPGLFAWWVLAGCATTATGSPSDGHGGGTGKLVHTTHQEYWPSPGRQRHGSGDYADIWGRIRAGLTLDEVQHPRIDKEVERYRQYPKTIEAASGRATPFMYLIVGETESRDLPTDVALLPFVESAFHTHAFSHGAASGLWQIVPGTGRRFKLTQDWWYDGRRDVAASTVAALTYLDYLHGHFDGDWLLALAAYNAGEGTVGRAVKRNRKRGRPTDFWNLDLPRETRAYVPRLLAVSRIVSNPERYGIDLAPIANEPVLAPVATNGQIDLAIAADLADMSVETLYSYNPGFNRWATPPDTPTALLLPIANAETFRQGLANLPPDARLEWTRYRVASGDTLSGIAVHHKTTAKVLRQANGLDGTLIRTGDHLLIPIAARSLDAYPSLTALKPATKGATRHYTVRQGDSLWSIARRHGVSHRDLARWNRIGVNSVLRPGTKLAIHGGKATTAQTGGMAPSQTVRYRVRRGDSLSRISAKFRVSVAQLKQWNELGGDSLIYPGQVLTIHVDPTRQT